MVLGETEITGQIKNAYETARAGGLTGRVLNRFFQKAFQAAKEIRTRAEIGRGAGSIKSAVVELMRRIFEDDLAGRAIMVWRRPDGRILRSTAGQKRRPLDSDFQSLSRSGHPLGGPAVMPPKGMPRQRP